MLALFNKSTSPPPSELRMRVDEFSVQISHRTDRMFWLRIDRSVPDAIIVSDLKRSEVDVGVAAAALDLAIAGVTSAAPASLVFLDVIPRHRADGRDGVLGRVEAELTEIVRTYADARDEGSKRSGPSQPSLSLGHD